MGVEVDRFVDSIPQEAICVVCCLVLDEPVETPCGHFYCLKCWQSHYEANIAESGDCLCAFCDSIFVGSETKRANVVWSLIQNLNVFCENRKHGCESVFKYCLRDLHEDSCAFASSDAVSKSNLSASQCTSCNQSYQPECRSNHDCVKALQAKLKEQSVQLTNLDLEKSRISFKFMEREKALLDRLAELEVQYHFESLKHHQELRDLQARVVSLQGELGMNTAQPDALTLAIDLLRLDGSLGFNIIGGAAKEGEVKSGSSGIFVSRVAHGGAADQPGKLKLHDQIIEVDGVDLCTATHEQAVQSFRKSGDPVKIVVRRHINKGVTVPRTKDAMTQIGGSLFAVTGPCDGGENLEVKNNPDLLYDSGFDTLMTHKSSRSSRASMYTENSDVETTSKSVSPEPLSNDGVVMRETKSPDYVASMSEKRNSAFYVIPTGDGSDADLTQVAKGWMDDATDEDQDMEYEYEYEEVRLTKEDGVFGLLLCYGGDSTDISVYVGDIEENSVADACGQVMVGDQIVKINDSHVNDVDEAYKMLRENNDITLVVARPMYDAYIPTYDDAQETDLDLDYLESIKEEPCSDGQSIHSDKSPSSVGSSSTNISVTPTQSPTKSPTRVSSKSSSTHTLQERDISQRTSSVSSASSSLSRDSKKAERKGSDTNNNLSDRDYQSPKHSSRNSSLERRDNLKKSSRHEHSNEQSSYEKRRDSSNSSKNSSKSRHSDNDSIKIQRKQYTESKQSGHFSPSVHRRHQSRSQNSPALRSAMKSEQRESKDSRTQRHVQIDPHPGWNETERKVWEEFKIIQRMEAAEKNQGNTDIEASWCVRRSKDGKHVYIKKTNTNRNKLLKERANQIKEERSGITTDDDAFTIYQGRYWSREDRRRQLIRHQEKKRRLIQKMNEKALIDHSAERQMAEMVQRKMTLPGTIFDDFLTVEEILSQRNRSGTFSGPIHVTTI